MDIYHRFRPVDRPGGLPESGEDYRKYLTRTGDTEAQAYVYYHTNATRYCASTSPSRRATSHARAHPGGTCYIDHTDNGSSDILKSRECAVARYYQGESTGATGFIDQNDARHRVLT